MVCLEVSTGFWISGVLLGVEWAFALLWRTRPELASSEELQRQMLSPPAAFIVLLRQH